MAGAGSNVVELVVKRAGVCPDDGESCARVIAPVAPSVGPFAQPPLTHLVRFSERKAYEGDACGVGRGSGWRCGTGCAEGEAEGEAKGEP